MRLFRGSPSILIAFACLLVAPGSRAQEVAPPETLSLAPAAEPLPEVCQAPPVEPPPGFAAPGPELPPAEAEEPAATAFEAREIPAEDGTVPPGIEPQGVVQPGESWPMVPVTRLPVVVRTAPERPVRLYRDACLVRAPEEEAKLDAAQRKLFETVCRANRWFDGLFGDEHPDAATNVTGRVELGGVYSEYEGFDSKSRFAVRWQLPNANRRLNAFVGRLNEDDVELDRQETIAMRSSFFDLEEDEEWLAGLGYSLPGNSRRKTDFAVAAKLSTEPEILARARARWLFYPGERTALRLRLTGLFQNREGFGITGHFDVDQVLGRNLLLRWGGSATESEESHGTEWRSNLVLYQNLPGDHAIAWELFGTGETEDDVPLHEYGARIIYRQRFLIDGVYIVPVLGYSYPRREIEELREGSGSVGISLEIRFGRWLAMR